MGEIGRRRKREKRQRPQTLMLLRERLFEVQTGAFKALALVRVSRRVERDQNKRVHVNWSITGGARNGRLWRAVNEPSGARLFSGD